jgi:hypothetical protein
VMRDDGGPAFPGESGQEMMSNGQWREPSYSGMTLRQWYKGMALLGTVQSGIVTANVEQRNPTKDIATWCAAISDALIAEDREVRIRARREKEEGK